MRRIRTIILLYGVLNAILYSSLMPLWEGFDEIFHYGHVQFLSTNLAFPVVGRTAISEEIWHSLELTPVSHYLQPFTKAPVNFRDYFGWSQEERLRRRQQLFALPPDEKYRPHEGKWNYEANQSPLAYLVMAAPDRALSGFSLPARVLCLRILGSVAAVALTFWVALMLARQLGLPAIYSAAALFCIFSSQMFYGTVAHVCNDWLAMPLMTVLISAGVLAAQNGSKRNLVLLGLAFSAALLTKAYFLFLAPFAVGIVGWHLWRRRTSWRAAGLFAGIVLVLAGPWYARNVILYKNLSATVESTTGVGFTQLLEASRSVPWMASIAYMAKSSLWTGNNSFTTFSATTLDIILALLFLSFILYACKFRRREAEVLTAGAVFLFCCGLAYITVTFFYSSKGGLFAAEPWYTAVLLAPVLLTAFLGLSRVEPFGRWAAAATILLWAYVLCATYLAKLLPLYGGLAEGRAHFGDLYSWYLDHGAERDAILGTTSLAGPPFLYAMAGAVILMNLGLCLALLRQLFRTRGVGAS